MNDCRVSQGAGYIPRHPDVSQQLDCDPIDDLARMVKDKSLPAALRARMLAEVRYIAPRRKAIAVTGQGGISIEMRDDGNR